jgi:hypothetical protein
MGDDLWLGNELMIAESTTEPRGRAGVGFRCQFAPLSIPIP